MWLAVILVCASTEVTSCRVVANTTDVWYSKEKCEADAVVMASTLLVNGFYAIPNCFKVGDSV
jgi:hypothetical protein|tara:strand:+ start:980 stop:1168 length:189 start_codon:yes stop_codon:yes gene_type:complete